MSSGKRRLFFSRPKCGGHCLVSGTRSWEYSVLTADKVNINTALADLRVINIERNLLLYIFAAIIENETSAL